MHIREITQNYEKEVTQETLPVVVEFYASWCPKCSMMRDVVERIATRNKDVLIFKKVNIDLSEEITRHLGVEIVPTFVIYQSGRILGYTSGVLSEYTLENRIFEMIKDGGEA